MPLPSVTIDIVGQNYKKGAEINIKIDQLHAHSIHLAEKLPRGFHLSFQKLSVRTSIMLPVYCLEHNLHVNRYTTFSEEHFRSGGVLK